MGSSDRYKNESTYTKISRAVLSTLIRVVDGGNSRSISLSNLIESIKQYFDPLTGEVVTKVADDYPVPTGVTTVLVDAASKNITITLPDISTLGAGSKKTIKKVDASGTYNVTINAAMGEFIDGNSTVTLSGVSRPFVRVLAYQGEYHIIGA